MHRVVLAACSYSYSYSYSVRQDGTRTRLLCRSIVPFSPGRCTASIRVCDGYERMGIGFTACGMSRCGRSNVSGIAVPTSRSSTSMSTVRCSGLSTSAMGSDRLWARTKTITKVEGLTQRESAWPTETFGASCCSGCSFVLALVLSPTGRYSYSIAMPVDCTIPPWSMHGFDSSLQWV